MDENDLPNEMSDMYSFCCLFWELFNGELISSFQNLVSSGQIDSYLARNSLVAIPWADMEWKQIRDEVLINNNSLQINFDMVPLPFSRIIKDGLSMNSINRMSFEDVKANLESVRSVSSGQLKNFERSKTNIL